MEGRERQVEKKNIDWGNIGFGYVQTEKRYVSYYKNGAWDQGTCHDGRDGQKPSPPILSLSFRNYSTDQSKSLLLEGISPRLQYTSVP